MPRTRNRDRQIGTGAIYFLDVDRLGIVPRRARRTPGGQVYHVLNRGCGRMRLFSRDSDYAAFERVLSEALQRESIRLLSYCLMPNHWHFALWPCEDGQLS